MPDQAEQAGHEALDLVAHDLDVARVGRRLERADDVDRHAGRGARRVDREAARASSQGLRCARCVMPQPASPSFQVVACCSANSSGVTPAFCGVALVDPRTEVGRRQVGEERQRLVRSPLGSMSRHGTPAVSASSIEHHAEAGLARTRHADDDAVGGEVAGRDHRRGAVALVSSRIDELAEAQVSHAGNVGGTAPPRRRATAGPRPGVGPQQGPAPGVGPQHGSAQASGHH